MKKLLITIGVLIPLITQAFSDLPEYHPNYTAITHLQKEGIISGYPDGSFRPDQLVNRVEALKIILLGSGINVPFREGSIFPDTLPAEWYAKYILRANELGIIEGYPDGTFKPTQTVNLVESLKILLLTKNIVLRDTDPWYDKYINFAKECSLMDDFDPSQAMTRGALAEMMYRLIIYVPPKPVKPVVTQEEPAITQEPVVTEEWDYPVTQEEPIITQETQEIVLPTILEFSALINTDASGNRRVDFNWEIKDDGTQTNCAIVGDIEPFEYSDIYLRLGEGKMLLGTNGNTPLIGTDFITSTRITKDWIGSDISFTFICSKFPFTDFLYPCDTCDSESPFNPGHYTEWVTKVIEQGVYATRVAMVYIELF